MKEISYNGELPDEETKKPSRSVGSEKVHALRTYGADADEMMVEKQISKIDIIEAEAKRRETRRETRLVHDESESSHMGAVIGGLIFLLVAGLGVGAYALFGGMPKGLVSFGTGNGIPSLGSGNNVESIAPIDIMLDGSPREQIIADISIAFSETSIPPDATREVRFLTGGENARLATANEFFASAALFAPGGLTRAFDPSVDYRIHMLDRASGVIILPVRSYPDAFSGMLAWEARIPSGLVPLLSPWVDRKRLTQLELSPSGKFTDARVAAADVRILKDASGKILLVYGFPTRETLVIAATIEGFTQATRGTSAK